MKNINLMYHPDHYVRQTICKHFLILLSGCALSWLVAHLIIESLTSKINILSGEIAALEKERTLAFRAKQNNPLESQAMHTQIHNLSTIATTIPDNIFLYQIKGTADFLLLEGNAINTGSVMTWIEELQTKFQAREKLTINAIKKSSAQDPFFKFILKIEHAQ